MRPPLAHRQGAIVVGSRPGVALIAVELPAAGLTRVRFGWSVLTQVTTSVRAAVSTDPQPPWIRRWWADASVAVGRRGWEMLADAVRPGRLVPNYLLPPPTGRPSLDDELAAMVATPPDRVAAELAAVAAGHPPSRADRMVAHRGTDDYLRALAAAVETWYRHALKPSWGTLRSGLQADLDFRAQRIAGHGLPAAFEADGGSMGWRDGLLLLGSSWDQVVVAEHGIAFGSSAFLKPAETLKDLKADAPSEVSYPIRGVAAALEPVPTSLTAQLVDLIGGIRAELLAGLDEPRTTSDLAGRHRLAASTVSYHLGVLHRAGLLDRVRRQRHVFYRQSDLGAALIARHR